MGKALTNIGNGGLESAPIARGTDPENLPASAAAVAGKPDCLRTSVKPGRNKPMAPQPPAALRANCHLGPLAKPAQLRQTLDGKVQEQYQGSVLREFYSRCLGGKGWSSTLYPISLIIGISSSLGRYNLPNSGFQSRHREQNHRPSVSTFCQTTADMQRAADNGGHGCSIRESHPAISSFCGRGTVVHPCLGFLDCLQRWSSDWWGCRAV